MCVCVWPACTSVHLVHGEAKESVTLPGSGVTTGSKLRPGCWELNPGPRGDQPVLFTAEPPLRPLALFLKMRSEQTIQPPTRQSSQLPTQ